MKSLNEQILDNLQAEKMLALQSGNKDRLSFLIREIDRVKEEIEKEKKDE